MHVMKCGASDFGAVKGEAMREEGFHSKVGTINDELTKDNYNLIDREPPEDIDEYIRNLGVKRKIRADAVRCVSVIVDYPADEERPHQEFFEASMKGIQEFFGVKDESVLYAQVHVDEHHPHMHLAFVPLVESEKTYKDGHTETQIKLSAKDVLTKEKLQEFHPRMQDYMHMQGFVGQIHFPERKNKYKDFSKHKLEQVNNEIAEKEKELEFLQEAYEQIDELYDDVSEQRNLTQKELEEAQGVLEDTLKAKNRNLDEIQKQEAILKHQEGQIQEKGQELASVDEKVKKLKGELVEQKDLKERTVDKTVLGKSKDTVTLPYEEYQALHKLATVQEDVKELHQELKTELAAVHKQKQDLEFQKLDLDYLTKEASDRLDNAPKYKEAYKSTLNELNSLKSANESLQQQLKKSEGLVERWHARAMRGQQAEKEVNFFHRLVGKFSEWVMNTLNKIFDFETVFSEPNGELSRKNREASSYGNTKGVYASWSNLNDSWQYYWKDSEGNEQNSNLQGALRRGYLPLVQELAQEDKNLTRYLDQDILEQAKEAQIQYQQHNHSRGRGGR